ncbi:MAG TPA: CDP-glycerol glycerophosphotransferase family protein [Methanocorpusculum sp.]|nr:CDP-glycerol glycerophosphotransferase family protein [Methanocorpusculum sp.]
MPLKKTIRLLSLILHVSGFWKGSAIILSQGLNRLLDKQYCKNPINSNLILFESDPPFTDNARVLYEYMIQRELDKNYTLLWKVDDVKTYKRLSEKGIDCVLGHSLFPRFGKHRYYFYGRTAHWIFHTHGHAFGNGYRKEQTIVNLWHGGMGFKSNKLIDNPSTYTLISGNGEICYSVAENFHRCKREAFLPFGMMRTDLLFKEKNIPSIDAVPGKKILWMPTFRHTNNPYTEDPTVNTETGLPIINSLNELQNLNETLSSLNIHLYIKLHRRQDANSVMHTDMTHIHMLSNESIEAVGLQLYEIFNHFDAMISDYSSVSFDYLYLDRPLGYTLDDFDKYKESRGFVMDNPLDYMPGHHIYTYEDFIQFVTDIAEGNDTFGSDREQVRNAVGLNEGGTCCQKLLDFLGIKN